MRPRPSGDQLDELLAAQVDYYRAVAKEYGESAIPDVPMPELESTHEALTAAIDQFRASGSVLELACGPGTWTPLLLRSAQRVTAVDAAPEMLEIAASNVRDERVRFVQADLFDWRPEERYDAVFFGFWLSHVPIERFDEFWSLIDRCLKPHGRVAFVDDGYRTADELIEGADSQVICRRLTDGTPFQAVKVPHTPAQLEQRLADLGWAIGVRYVGGPFFWGAGARAADGVTPAPRPTGGREPAD